ncbi:MAG TPA: periplasmic heavy metal sensor [Pyrinomonadaceae bacterium]|nr:periplasmic heavy metal sensor [Pyrinomonadaceae bacterium]
MDKISKNRWQVRIAAVIIFLLGFAAGGLALNAYRGWARGRAATPEDRFEQLSKRLELNSEQKTKVQQILGDTREQLRAVRKDSEPRVNDIRQQTDQRLQQVLTPDQWQRFQQMRNEMRARRGRDGRDDGP